MDGCILHCIAFARKEERGGRRAVIDRQVFYVCMYVCMLCRIDILLLYSLFLHLVQSWATHSTISSPNHDISYASLWLGTDYILGSMQWAGIRSTDLRYCRQLDTYCSDRGWRLILHWVPFSRSDDDIGKRRWLDQVRRVYPSRQGRLVCRCIGCKSCISRSSLSIINPTG